MKFKNTFRITMFFCICYITLLFIYLALELLNFYYTGEFALNTITFLKLIPRALFLCIGYILLGKLSSFLGLTKNN